MAGPAISEEGLHKILQQIQSQLIHWTRELNMVKAQLQSAENARKRAELTYKQIDEEQGARLWNGVGKMFMLEDKSTITATLKKKERELSDEIANLSKKQKFLEKEVGQAQGHMRDIFRGVEAQQA